MVNETEYDGNNSDSAESEYYDEEVARLLCVGVESAPEPARKALTVEDCCPPEVERPLRVLNFEAEAEKRKKKAHPFEQWGTARQLMAKEIPPLRWLIEGLLPPGLTILAGPPKAGKSWLALDISLGVARAGSALGAIPCHGGQVIYIALEDNERRLQSRINIIYPDSQILPITWRYHLAAPIMPEFLTWLEVQVMSWQPCALVVLDTFGRVTEDKGAKASYRSDYTESARLQEFALRHDLSLLVVHHTRKGRSSDPFEDISGTYGVTGSADTLMVLCGEYGEETATLHVRGRDVEHQAHSLRFEGGLWRYQGLAQAIRFSQEENEIIDLLLRDPCGKTFGQINAALDCGRNTLKQRLRRMVNRNHIKHGSDGHYLVTSMVGIGKGSPLG